MYFCDVVKHQLEHYKKRKGAVIIAGAIIERFRVTFTASVRFKVRDSQNRKWADENSLKQFLCIKLAWTHWFPFGYDEQ